MSESIWEMIKRWLQSLFPPHPTKEEALKPQPISETAKPETREEIPQVPPVTIPEEAKPKAPQPEPRMIVPIAREERLTTAPEPTAETFALPKEEPTTTKQPATPIVTIVTPQPTPPPAPAPAQPPPPTQQTLNYGKIERLEWGAFQLIYNGKGYGCNVIGDASTMQEQANGIDASADRSIASIQEQQNYIKQGYYVGECVQAKFFVQPTPELVADGCQKFQGGWTGHYWTMEELEALKEPYKKMKEDAQAIRVFLSYYG
jgi:hypothetical protein